MTETHDFDIFLLSLLQGHIEQDGKNNGDNGPTQRLQLTVVHLWSLTC